VITCGGCFHRWRPSLWLLVSLPAVAGAGHSEHASPSLRLRAPLPLTTRWGSPDRSHPSRRSVISVPLGAGTRNSGQWPNQLRSVAGQFAIAGAPSSKCWWSLRRSLEPGGEQLRIILEGNLANVELGGVIARSHRSPVLQQLVSMNIGELCETSATSFPSSVLRNSNTSPSFTCFRTTVVSRWPYFLESIAPFRCVANTAHRPVSICSSILRNISVIPEVRPPFQCSRHAERLPQRLRLEYRPGRMPPQRETSDGRRTAWVVHY
jgi:hypothetical protein